MMDLTVISTALGSIKTAADIAKLIKDSDVSLEKAETKLKLAELISALADAKFQMAEIQHALLEKDTEVQDLRDQLVIKGKVNWEKPYYWLVDGDTKDGPYCQHCYDANSKLIRLQGGRNGLWVCKACKCEYRDSTWKSAGVVTVRRDYDPFSRY